MHTIHQIWFDIGNGNMPARNHQETMRRTSGMDVATWDLKSAEALLQRVHYPQLDLLELWKRLPHGINKADFFRYVLLYRLGGAYFDLDFVCARPLADFFRPNTVVLAEEWPFSLRDGSLHNGAMICRDARHPFWEAVFDEIHARLGALRGDADRGDIQRSVFKLTGTAMLRDVAVKYLRGSRAAAAPVVVAPFGVFCPLLNHDGACIDSYESARAAGTLRNLRLPERAPANAHTHAFLAPAPKLWQQSFPPSSRARAPPPDS